MAENLGLTRDQYKPIVGDDFLAQRQFEQLFDRSNEIPALQDGVDDNTIGLDTLSDLVRPITIDPIEPLTGQVSGDTSFNIPTTPTIKTVWIPVAYLVAASGGPWVLTITTGIGTTVQVPIGASGDTISSGDLLFDIQVDDSGNVISKAWAVSGSNANGKYIESSDSTLECRFLDSVDVTTSQVTGTIFRSTPDSPYTFPVAFVGDLPIVVPICQSSSGLVWGVLSAVSATPVSLTGVLLRAEGSSIAGTGALGYMADGQWRT